MALASRDEEQIWITKVKYVSFCSKYLIFEHFMTVSMGVCKKNIFNLLKVIKICDCGESWLIVKVRWCL